MLMDFYEFAVQLHSLKCRSSHMDQCSWEYELVYPEIMWTKDYSAHKSWSSYAKNLQEELPNYSLEQIIEVLKAIKTCNLG
jgi:hypothetical protein